MKVRAAWHLLLVAASAHASKVAAEADDDDGGGAVAWITDSETVVVGNHTERVLHKHRLNVSTHNHDSRAAEEEAEEKLDFGAGPAAWKSDSLPRYLSVVSMTLVEGKKHEVRRAWQHFGFPVLRLERLAFGPFELGLLQPNEAEEVSSEEVRALLHGKSRKGLKQQRGSREQSRARVPRSRTAG